MTNEYPNIFALEKINKYLDEWIYSSKYIWIYSNIRIFVPHCLRPLLSITFPQGFRISKDIGHPTSGSGGKKTVKRYLKSEKKKSEKKNLFCGAILDNFLNKNFHIWDHFFPLLFPKDSESLKILDIQLWEVGEKRPLNGTSKVNRQTDGHTDRRTHGQTDI